MAIRPSIRSTVIFQSMRKILQTINILWRKWIPFRQLFCKLVKNGIAYLQSLLSDRYRCSVLGMKIINYRNMYTCRLKNLLQASNCKKTLIKIGVYCIFLSIAILIVLIPNIVRKSENERVDQKSTRFKTDLKYILFWKQPKKNKKNFYNKDMEYLPGQTQFIKQNCPYINCYISNNKSILNTEENFDFDAIVFSIHDLKKVNTNNLKLRRKKNQIYIFKSQESSQHHPICNPFFDNFFNWTWTYKLNSDIPHPFINIHNAQTELIGPKSSIDWVKDMKHTDKYNTKIDAKKKAVAWLVTNCKLKHKHEDFVNALREELKGYNHTLDTFGPCSEMRCPKGGITKCFNMIDKYYFFNLILEDSSAEDYITEKMVKGMTYVSIPIVGGSTNFSK